MTDSRTLPSVFRGFVSLTVLTLCVILVGCGTAYNPLRGPGESPNFVPGWYEEPPVEDDFLYASARGRSTNPSQAVQRARREATGEFTTVLAEALARFDESEGDTAGQLPPRAEALLDRVESDPTALLQREASRVERGKDQYVAYVLLRVPLDDLRPTNGPGLELPELNRLRDNYNELLLERAASREAF